MNTSRTKFVVTRPAPIALRRCALALLCALLLYVSPWASGLRAALNSPTSPAQTSGVAATQHSTTTATEHAAPAGAVAAGCTLSGPDLHAPAMPDVVKVYSFTLSGSAESPPNASTATGSGYVSIDTVNQMMTVNVTFSGLAGNTTAAHIHSPTAVPGTGTAGVATTTPSFASFPLGVSSGTYSQTLDMTQASSYNPAFAQAVPAAAAALVPGSGPSILAAVSPPLSTQFPPNIVSSQLNKVDPNVRFRRKFRASSACANDDRRNKP